MNPRSHLRLVYEANPLSFIAEQVAFHLSMPCFRRLAEIHTRALQEEALGPSFVMATPYMCGLKWPLLCTLARLACRCSIARHWTSIFDFNMQAGGRGSDGNMRILDIQPEKLHQRLPLFLGSPEDIAELESYGDVQQVGEKKYTI